MQAGCTAQIRAGQIRPQLEKPEVRDGLAHNKLTVHDVLALLVENVLQLSFPLTGEIRCPEAAGVP